MAERRVDRGARRKLGRRLLLRRRRRLLALCEVAELLGAHRSRELTREEAPRASDGSVDGGTSDTAGGGGGGGATSSRAVLQPESMVAHRNKVAPEPPPVAPYKKVEWEFSSPLKGETEAQRLHANEILKRAEDTSIDGPWDVAPSWTSTDYYTIAVMVPCLLPQILIIFPLLFVLLLLPVALNICYVSTAGGPAKTLESCLLYTSPSPRD